MIPFMGVLKITESILGKFAFHETLTEFRVTCWPKLALTPVGQLCSLPRSRILLNIISQFEHHLIDLGLQGIHFSTGINLVESPSIAAAEILAKPRTCVVKFDAMVLADKLKRNMNSNDNFLKGTRLT
jgi:hypothetical protein